MAQEPQKPVAEFTIIIGGVDFGIYHYRNHLPGGSNGFHICPVAEASLGALGFTDPEESARIGFSAPRDKAVAVGADGETPHPLKEHERDIAIAVRRLLEEDCKHLDLKPGSPAAFAENAYDSHNATSCHVEYTGTSFTERTGSARDVLKNDLIKRLQGVHNLTWHHPEMLLPKEEAPSREKEAANQPSHPLGDVRRRLEAVGAILLKHFPAKGLAEKRSAAVAALLRLDSLRPSHMSAAPEMYNDDTRIRAINGALNMHLGGDALEAARKAAAADLVKDINLGFGQSTQPSKGFRREG